MKIRHFGIFRNNDDTLNWEKLRNDKDETPYFLPYTKEEYFRKVERDKPTPVAVAILNEIKNSGLQKVFSLGSGIAFMEFQLKKFSENVVVVSDNNPSVLRIKQFSIFDDAIILDALADPLPIDKNWIVIFPRIDTEFNDDQFRDIFHKCHSVGIKNIIFIPAGLLSIRILIAELKIRLLSLVKSRPLVFCGYARSMGTFRKIWGTYYKLTKSSKGHQVLFLEQILK